MYMACIQRKRSGNSWTQAEPGCGASPLLLKWKSVAPQLMPAGAPAGKGGNFLLISVREGDEFPDLEMKTNETTFAGKIAGTAGKIAHFMPKGKERDGKGTRHLQYLTPALLPSRHSESFSSKPVAASERTIRRSREIAQETGSTGGFIFLPAAKPSQFCIRLDLMILYANTLNSIIAINGPMAERKLFV